jgi:anti-sigma regulatory factor (Ser/Thr protein kinase)
MKHESTYPPDLSAVPQARRVAIGALREAGLEPSTLSTVHTVLAELVANAARHAGTDFTVCATIDGQKVRVEVFDRDTRLPALAAIDADSTSGRGLHIVSALSTAWGWEAADRDGITGKLVWAEFVLCAADVERLRIDAPSAYGPTDARPT